jgi:hypothetical protein
MRFVPYRSVPPAGWRPGDGPGRRRAENHLCMHEPEMVRLIGRLVTMSVPQFKSYSEINAMLERVAKKRRRSK